MRLRAIASMTSLVLASLADSAAAGIEIITPEYPIVSYAPTPYDVPGPAYRIEIQNTGTSALHDLSYLTGQFVIVDEGGSLEPGGYYHWDVACLPTQAYMDGGYLDIDVCSWSCGDEEHTYSVFLDCPGGPLTADSYYHGIFAHAYSSEATQLQFVNTSTAPVTITALAASQPEFTVEALGAALPRTLAPSEAIDLDVVFHATATPEIYANIDVYAGASIIGRTGVDGQTRNQLRMAGTYIEVPLGATRRIPLLVRNSYPSTRTIATVASDAPAHAVSGVAGTTLAPAASQPGALTVTGDSLGWQQRVLSLAFDAGQGDAQPYGVRVVPATYQLDAEDATPDDGAVDFGDVALDAAPIDRAFTLRNLTSTAVAITSCDPLVAPFAYVGACPTELPALGSVQVTVRFTPATLGPALYGFGVTLATGSYAEGFVSGNVVEADDPPGDGGGSGSGSGSGSGGGGSGGGGCGHVGSGDDPGCSVGGAGSGMLLALFALRRRRRSAGDVRQATTYAAPARVASAP